MNAQHPDKDWFRRRLRAKGLTTEALAQAIGRDRAVVSRIINGHQKITVEQAQAFARVLDVEWGEVLAQAGMIEPAEVEQTRPGFSEGDAAPYVGMGEERVRALTPADALGRKPGVDVWQVRTAALMLMGYLPGDFLLVDTHQAERARTGDVVVAQVYDNHRGTATTILRRLEPPVLVAASCDPDDRRVHVVDGVNVVVRGKVTASWRV
jgi:transcriptional regulator with XRE-family HTH domain